MPSAHTGRMRWKSCFFDGSLCFSPAFTCHLISRLCRQLPLKGKPLTSSIRWCSTKLTLLTNRNGFPLLRRKAVFSFIHRLPFLRGAGAERLRGSFRFLQIQLFHPFPPLVVHQHQGHGKGQQQPGNAALGHIRIVFFFMVKGQFLVLHYSSLREVYPFFRQNVKA